MPPITLQVKVALPLNPVRRSGGVLPQQDWERSPSCKNRAKTASGDITLHFFKFLGGSKVRAKIFQGGRFPAFPLDYTTA